MVNLILGIYAVSVTVVGTAVIYKLHRSVIKYNRMDLMHYLKAILSDLHASAVITNEKGTIEFMNEQFIQNSGYAPAELLHQKISMLKASSDVDFIADDLWHNITKGHVWRGPFMNLSKTGRPYTEEFVVFPIKAPSGKVYFCALGNNVTNRYLEEKEIEKLQRKSIKFKENFISNLSHEVRTPLNALVGLSQLGVNCDNMAKSQNYFLKINTASKQLMQLVDDILDFSKIENGDFALVRSRFNFMSLLTALTSQYGPLAAEKHLEFNFFMDEFNPQYLFADSFRLEQILSNLLSNAVKFTEHGEIRLEIELKINAPNGYLLAFKIKDTGIGMDQGQLKGIFNPFSNLVADNQKRRNNSSGLGMAITKQIVDLMGGTIFIDSNPETGTTIDVTLPFALEDVELPKPYTSNLLDALKVIVVEESDVSRTNAVNMLSAFGYDVQACPSGECALSLLQTDKPVDLILLSWQIEWINGIDALTAIVASRLQTPRIIYITPFPATSMPTEMRRHIDGYLPKPYTAPMLFDVISSVFMSQPIASQTTRNAEGMFAGFRFLLIDDNPVNNLIAKSMLEQEGATITTLQSAPKALEHLTESRYHLIISDIDMPVMDGFEFLAAFRLTNTNTPVFALTANTGDENRQDIHNAGFDFYISKPLTQQKLKQIREYLESKQIVADSAHTNQQQPLSATLASKEVKCMLSPQEVEFLVISLESLLHETEFRKPKGCKERILQIRNQAPACDLFLQLIDQIQSDLSRYRFEQMIDTLHVLIADLGGGQTNESS